MSVQGSKSGRSTWAAILMKKKRLDSAFVQGKLKITGNVEDAIELRNAFMI